MFNSLQYSKPLETKSAEKTYFRKLQEVMEIEQEFASIMGHKRQMNTYFDFQSDSSVAKPLRKPSVF